MTEVLGMGYLSNMLCEGAFLDETLRIKKKKNKFTANNFSFAVFVLHVTSSDPPLLFGPHCFGNGCHKVIDGQ